MSLSQSTLTSFFKGSKPETHDADDGTSNVVHSKKKEREDNKKKYETKRIRKFEPAWQKEFDWVVYQEETNKMYCSTCRKYAELADKSSPMYIGCGDGVYILPFSIVVVVYFWTSSFVVWTSKIHIVLIPRDK